MLQAFSSLYADWKVQPDHSHYLPLFTRHMKAVLKADRTLSETRTRAHTCTERVAIDVETGRCGARACWLHSIVAWLILFVLVCPCRAFRLSALVRGFLLDSSSLVCPPLARSALVDAIWACWRWAPGDEPVAADEAVCRQFVRWATDQHGTDQQTTTNGAPEGADGRRLGRLLSLLSQLPQPSQFSAEPASVAVESATAVAGPVGPLWSPWAGSYPVVAAYRRVRESMPSLSVLGDLAAVPSSTVRRSWHTLTKEDVLIMCESRLCVLSTPLAKAYRARQRALRAQARRGDQEKNQKAKATNSPIALGSTASRGPASTEVGLSPAASGLPAADVAPPTRRLHQSTSTASGASGDASGGPASGRAQAVPSTLAAARDNVVRQRQAAVAARAKRWKQTTKEE